MDRTNNRGRTVLVSALLLLLTLGTFWPVGRHDFINFDDPDYVTDNPQVQAGVTVQGLAWAFLNLHGLRTYWHPVTWVSHMLDCELFGLNPGPHHLVNLLFHVANVILLLLLLRRMTGSLWRSAVVAALFALHPLQVDTVAWIAERKNVLSTLFWFLTTLAYVRYAEAPNVRRYLVLLPLYGIGLMCKPALVTLPCTLLLLDFWPLRRFAWANRTLAVPGGRQFPVVSLKLLTLEKVPLFLMAVASGLATILAHQGLRSVDLTAMPLGSRLGNAIVSYARYLGKAFWPDNLAVFYPHPGAWPIEAVLGSAALLVLGTALAVFLSRRAPYLVVGWFWFVGVLVPMSGIIQAGAQAMADRFAYVPLVGLFVLVVWGAWDLALRFLKNPVPLRIAAAVVIAVCAFLSSRQVSHWKNSITVFSHALNVTENNHSAHFSLGNALADQGRMTEAMRHWEAALAIAPSHAEVHGRIASALAEQGDAAGAIARYRKALEIDPELADALNNLAWLLATHPDPAIRNGPEAVRLAEKACELTQYERTVMMGTLAAAYAEVGRFEDAAATAERALRNALRSNEKDLAVRNRELLQRYRSGRKAGS